MSDLDRSLGFLLTRAARGIKRKLDERLKPYHVTSTQYIFLCCLWEQDHVRLRDIGHLLDFDNPTVTHVVDRMVQDKLVVKRKDKNDRRALNVVLTERGRELQTVLDKVAEEVNQEALQSFTEQEKELINQCLVKIWSTLDNSR